MHILENINDELDKDSWLHRVNMELHYRNFVDCFKTTEQPSVEELVNSQEFNRYLRPILTRLSLEYSTIAARMVRVTIEEDTMNGVSFTNTTGEVIAALFISNRERAVDTTSTVTPLKFTIDKETDGETATFIKRLASTVEKILIYRTANTAHIPKVTPDGDTILIYQLSGGVGRDLILVYPNYVGYRVDYAGMMLPLF